MRTEKQYFIYFMASYSGVLYLGMTNDLIRRACEHKEGFKDGFTNKYKCNRLIYYEVCDNPYDAICREKEIKKWRREKKVDLIKTMNPLWKDLYDQINC